VELPSLNNLDLTTVIFDLDGTLIDSAQGILDSMQRAFESCSLLPVLPLESSLIGPPLRETLQRLSPESDSVQIEQLAQSFIESYDKQGCLEAHPFLGIDEMLHDLKRRGVALHIATNKRAYPTQKILAHLGWDGLFGCVYSIDSFPGPAWNKSQLLRRLLMEEGLRSDHCVYVGDREEDAVAASENGLAFIWADWDASWVASMRRLFR